MRVSLLLTLSYLYTAVLAGGYQECLGRIWMYQAYQIDGLNDEDSRTIGFKCIKWNEKTKVCDTGYKPCEWRNGRCNFDEWSHFLGKTNLNTGWAVYQSGSTERLNFDETAKICYKRFITDKPAAQTKKSVPQPPPYPVMKDLNGPYNEQIKQVSKVVNDAYKTKRTAETQHLWDDLDEVVQKIVIARAGDHGPYVIEKAKEYFNNVLDVKTEDLGNNPGTGQKWERVDWEETRAEAERKGVEDVDKRIRGFLTTFYRADKQNKSARDHLSVIMSFKRARDRDVSCR